MSKLHGCQLGFVKILISTKPPVPFLASMWIFQGLSKSKPSSTPPFPQAKLAPSKTGVAQIGFYLSTRSQTRRNLSAMIGHPRGNLVSFLFWKGPSRKDGFYDTPDIFSHGYHQKRRYLRGLFFLKPSFFGIHVKFIGCIISNFYYDRATHNVMVTFTILVKIWRNYVISYAPEVWNTFQLLNRPWRWLWPNLESI